MARRRDGRPTGERPPIPERLLHDDGWLTDEELARHNEFARTASRQEVEDAGVALGVKAWRRQKEAADRWAAENGYSQHEMYQAWESAHMRGR